MKWPRKGILIRLAIYLPIIGFLSYQAFFKKPDVDEASQATPQAVEPRTRTIEGPDGKEFKIIEITPEEAKAMGVEVPESKTE